MKVTCKYCGHKFETDKYRLKSGSDINCPQCGHCMQEPFLTDVTDDIDSLIIANNNFINLQEDILDDYNNDDTDWGEDACIEPVDKLNALFEDIKDDSVCDFYCIEPTDDIDTLIEDISDDSEYIREDYDCIEAIDDIDTLIEDISDDSEYIREDHVCIEAIDDIDTLIEDISDDSDYKK